MKNKDKVTGSPERKQTVTITLGPRTVEALESWRKSVADNNAGLDIPLTAVAGAALMNGLVEWLKSGGGTVDRAWTSTCQ